MFCVIFLAWQDYMGCANSAAQEATYSHFKHALWVAATLERIVFGLVLHCRGFFLGWCYTVAEDCFWVATTLQRIVFGLMLHWRGFFLGWRYTQEDCFWAAAPLERIVFGLLLHWRGLGLVLHCSRGLVMAIARPLSLLTIQILTRSYRHVYYIYI